MFEVEAPTVWRVVATVTSPPFTVVAHRSLPKPIDAPATNQACVSPLLLADDACAMDSGISARTKVLANHVGIAWLYVSSLGVRAPGHLDWFTRVVQHIQYPHVHSVSPLALPVANTDSDLSVPTANTLYVIVAK